MPAIDRTCPQCGKDLPDLPLCYATEAPWRMLGVTESEFDKRVELSADLCVVDEKFFFVRGHIEIPVLDTPSRFAWSVWCSLSEQSFRHLCERWDDAGRDQDPPYFGWLTSLLPGYPETLHMKTSVQSRDVGVVPLVTVFEPAEHPLVHEQGAGISMARIHEFAHLILHKP